MKTYLRVKNAFSVRPVQAVATAMTKVVIPKVEWIGTRAARNDAVADSQHNKSKKLKKPTINCKKRVETSKNWIKWSAWEAEIARFWENTEDMYK